MTSRADLFTASKKKQEYYSDLPNNMTLHPITGVLTRVTNEDSVRQSLKNLVLTNLGERLFQPTIGGDVRRALFEPNDTVTASNIAFFIKQTIKANEPRATLLNVIVNPRPESYSFDVSIVFSVINNPQPIYLNIVLRRVR
jgi:phage baseplate assembly protein W